MTALTALVRLLYRNRFSDLCYGYTAFWRRLLPVLEPEAPGFEIEAQLNTRALVRGLKVFEVPSFERVRIYLSYVPPLFLVIAVPRLWTGAYAPMLVKLKFFAGLNLHEAAAALGVPPRSADRLWAFARAWLVDALDPS